MLLLVVAQAGAAWWFGGVLLTAQFWMSWVVILGLTAAWLQGLGVSDQGSRVSVTSIILMGAIALGSLQLSVSPALVDSLGAESQRWREHLTSTPAGSGEISQPAYAATQGPLSLNPYATRLDLAALAAVAAVLLAASVAGQFKAALLAGLLGIAGHSAVLSLFGLVQQMTSKGLIYWTIKGPHDQFFAAFVNPNNGGGYFNLGVGASLGLMWYAFARVPRDGDIDLKRLYPSLLPRLSHLVRRELAELNAWKLTTLVIAGLNITAVLCTLSRGAIVSIIAGIILTSLAVTLARRTAGGVVGAAAVVTLGIGLAAWIGMTDAIAAEIATISDDLETGNGRFPLWAAVVPGAFRFGLLGSGLGTFRHIHRSLLTIPERSWFYHAENQYVEALLDGGIVGLALLVLALLTATIAALRLVGRTRDRIHAGFACATIFALLTQAIHAAFDFGLYLPANAWCLAILVGGTAGAVMTLPRHRRSSGESEAAAPRPTSLLGFVPVIGVWTSVVASLAFGLVHLERASRLEQVMRSIPDGWDSLEPDRKQVQQWVAQLEPLCVETGSGEGWAQLAELHEGAFRSLWLDRLAPEVSTAEQRAAWWPTTVLFELQRRCQVSGRVAGAEGVRAVLVATGGEAELVAADRALRKARRAAPILPGVHLKLAETCLVSEPLEAVPGHLARALELAPQAPNFQFLAGLYDLYGDRLDDASARWRRAIELAPDRQLVPVVSIALDVLDLNRVIEKVIPTAPQLQLDAATRLKGAGIRFETLRRTLLERAEVALDRNDRTPEEHLLYGRVLRASGREAEAIPAYEAALSARRYEREWRLEFATVLTEIGELDRAQRELDRVVMLGRDWAPAQRLQERLKQLRSKATRPGGS